MWILFSFIKIPPFRNYRKAAVALLEWYGGYPEDRENYSYEIGQIFVEYCVEELGGMQKFMSAFNDYR